MDHHAYIASSGALSSICSVYIPGLLDTPGDPPAGPRGDNNEDPEALALAGFVGVVGNVKELLIIGAGKARTPAGKRHASFEIYTSALSLDHKCDFLVRMIIEIQTITKAAAA